MHEWMRCWDEAANHQLPIAVAFWIIWIVFTQERSVLMQDWMQIRCSTCSVMLNVMVTRCTCSCNGIYLSHWQVQWSCHCSRMRIPVYSPWLLGYMGVAPTVLVKLTTPGLSLDRPCMPPKYFLHKKSTDISFLPERISLGEFVGLMKVGSSPNFTVCSRI